MRVLTVILALGLAGCGGGSGVPAATPSSTGAPPPPDARASLAALAAAAQDRIGVSLYSLAADRSVMVVRAADRTWRVDIPGGAHGGAVDVSMVSTAEGLFQCSPEQCVAVSELTAAIDPVFQHVFTDWLEVLTDRAAPISVAAAGDDGCFSVEPTTTSVEAPVAGGVYCFGTDGTITRVELELGTLTLAGSDPAAPPTVALPAPVGPGPPLATAAPPSPTVTPSP